MAITNGTTQFDENNVTSEVDRILASINVNGFIKGDRELPGQIEDGAPQPTKEPQADVKSTSTTVPSAIPRVTSIFANFIADAKPTLLNSDLREQLYECILDYLGVTAAGAKLAPSSTPILNGILAFSQHQNAPAGKGSTVITQSQIYPPHIAALLNGSYGHSLDFDDTHADSSLHAGVTAISVALAEAEFQLRQDESTNSISTDLLLLSILLGYEITIRVGVALSQAAYSRGFHLTSVAGIFGCVATLSVLRGLSADVVTNAFGLAGSKAAGSMQYLANGSHNKRLHAGFAAHDAFMCVSLAEAGVIGADAIIEGDLGLLQGYTDRDRADVDWSRLISDLGTRWEFTDSALKPYAGCRMTHGFIEIADSLGKYIREGKFADKKVHPEGLKCIKKIRCIMPKPSMILVGQTLPNKIHPQNIVDAQFSAYYQTANAICFGGTHDMAAYAPERLQDSNIRGLCSKTECLVDERMTGFACRMDVFLQDEDGNVVDVVKRTLPEPLGERQHPFVREKVEAKFLGLMKESYEPRQNRSNEVRSLVETISKGGNDGGVILKLMGLLAIE